MGESAAGSFWRTQPRGLLVLILEWHVQSFLRPAPRPAPAGAASTGHPWNPAGLPALIKERQLCFQTEVKGKRKKGKIHPENKRSERPRGSSVSFLGKGKGL